MSKEKAIKLIIKYSFKKFERTLKFLMKYDCSMSISDNARALGYKKANASYLVRRYKLPAYKQANQYGYIHYSKRRN